MATPAMSGTISCHAILRCLRGTRRRNSTGTSDEASGSTRNARSSPVPLKGAGSGTTGPTQDKPNEPPAHTRLNNNQRTTSVRHQTGAVGSFLAVPTATCPRPSVRPPDPGHPNERVADATFR
ncbi:hypothetical protein GCM10010308_34960 [Streptomyces vinaceusdrappus]|nr:hypothetical protein GCM10010308_34960 [Streptomyces vinaceusdrappus]